MRRSEVTWCARAAVWIGVSLLFVMAFSDREFAAVSVPAVLATGAGVVVLAYSIPFRTRQDSEVSDPAAEETSHAQ